MIYIIILIITIGSIIWVRCDYEHEFLTGFTMVLSVMLTLLLSVAILVSHIGLEGQKAGLEQRYESLNYQFESSMYDNDNDIGKKELMSEITDWNETLARKQANQRNFWLGIFTPNIYDDFKFIEFGEVVNEGLLWHS